MALSDHTKDHLTRGLGSIVASEELDSILGAPYGSAWFVDTFNGSDQNTGQSWANAYGTMAQALSAAQTGDSVYFRGDVREEITGSNLKFDIRIIGVGGKHHPDQPSSIYDPGAAMWRPPASPTTATPLLAVRGRGWEFHNIVFDCPVDAAAVQLNRNASSGTDEYDASHAVFVNCLFRSGKYGIEFADGCHNVLIDGCEFFLINASGSGAGIVQIAASVALGLKNTVRNCIFSGTSSAGANDRHIIVAWQGSHIYDNIFGKVTSTGIYIDLTLGGTGGNDNVVCKNVFGGAYTTADYVNGTNDLWLGNWVTVVSTQAPNGYTILPPAA